MLKSVVTLKFYVVVPSFEAAEKFLSEGITALDLFVYALHVSWIYESLSLNRFVICPFCGLADLEKRAVEFYKVPTTIVDQ